MVDAYQAWLCSECGQAFDTREEAEACCELEEEPEEDET